MITSREIAEYIDFLHFKKYSAPAPEELKKKWGIVPDADIPGQLGKLYQYWNMSLEDGRGFEQEFLSRYSPQNNVQPELLHKQPVEQQYTSPAATGGSRSFFARPLIWVIVVLLAALAFYVYTQLNKPGTDRSVPNDASITNNTPDPAGPVEKPAIAVPTDTTEPVQDDEAEKNSRIATLQTLIRAEENRDMDQILSLFSPEMTAYWDLKKPTKEQIRNRYHHTWGITDENKHKNVSVKKVSKNVYDLYGEYSFYSVRDSAYKTVPVHTRYIFDDSGKIVNTYGVK